MCHLLCTDSTVRYFLSSWGPDPDATFYSDADPDPDPSLQIKAQILERVLKWAHIPYRTFWLITCKLMRMRFLIQLKTLMPIWIRIFF
jgi:hypothetical protein